MDDKFSDFKSFLESFNEMSLRYTECGSKRKVIQFKDLAKEDRAVFKECMTVGEFKENASFLFCQNCAEFSILSSIETSLKI